MSGRVLEDRERGEKGDEGRKEGENGDEGEIQEEARVLESKKPVEQGGPWEEERARLFCRQLLGSRAGVTEEMRAAEQGRALRAWGEAQRGSHAPDGSSRHLTNSAERL